MTAENTQFKSGITVPAVAANVSSSARLRAFVSAISCVLICTFWVACSSSSTQNANPQQDPRNTVLMFKQCLDSNNIDAALALMAHPSGRAYVVLEQYELRDEVARLQRILSNSTITNISKGESSDSLCIMKVEFDYQNNYNVQCVRLSQRWFISSFGNPVTLSP